MRRRLGRKPWVEAGVAAYGIAFGLVSSAFSNHLPRQISHGTGLVVAFAILAGIAVFGRRWTSSSDSVGHWQVRRTLLANASAVIRSYDLNRRVAGPLDNIAGVATVVDLPDPRRFRSSPTRLEVPIDQLGEYIAAQARRSAIITGVPGVGKTTVLLNLARRAVAGQKSRNEGLPLWLDLEDMPPKMSIEAWITDVLTRSSVPEQNIQRLLSRQELALFFDGLDRIPSTQDQQHAYDAIVDYATAHGMAAVLVSCQAETYERLSRHEEVLPRVHVEPITAQQALAVLDQLGAGVAGLKSAATRDRGLLATVRTPLYLRAAVWAFAGASEAEIFTVRTTSGWDRAILEAYITVLIDERGNDKNLPTPVITRFLTWLAQILERNKASSFYGFLSPSRLLDPQSRERRVPLPRALSLLALSGALAAAAGWIVVGPKTAVACFFLGIVGNYLLDRHLQQSLQLEITTEERAWSGAAFQASAPGLVARVLIATAGLLSFQLVAHILIGHARRVGGMSATQARTCTIIITVFTALVFMSFIYSYLDQHARATVEKPLDLNFDSRPRARSRRWARLRQWLDLDLAIWFAVAGAFIAGLWSAAYSLLSSFQKAHLRSALVEQHYHGLLHWMNFAPRSVLATNPGVGWTIEVAIVMFVLGWLEWIVYDLWTDHLFEVWVDAAQIESGLGAVDIMDALEYARYLTLLRRVGGSFSFDHPTYQAYFGARPRTTLTPSAPDRAAPLH